MSVGLCLCSATVLLQQLEVAQLRESLAGLAGGVSPRKESQAFCEVRNFTTQLYSLIGVSHAQELCC